MKVSRTVLVVKINSFLFFCSITVQTKQQELLSYVVFTALCDCNMNPSRAQQGLKYSTCSSACFTPDVLRGMAPKILGFENSLSVTGKSFVQFGQKLSLDFRDEIQKYATKVIKGMHSIWYIRRGWNSWKDCSALRRDGILLVYINTWWEGVKQVETDSSWWHPVKKGNNEHKLKYRNFYTDIRKKLF